MNGSILNRRNFLKKGGALAVGVSVAGCTEDSAETPANPPNSDATTDQPPADDTADDTTDERTSTTERETEEELELGYLHGLTGFTYPPDTDGNHFRRFEWDAAGYEWWYEMNIPKALGEYYSERYSRSRNYDMYITDAYGESYISSMADEFQRMGEENELSEREIFNVVVKFVQQMEYTKDSVTSPFDQYSYYPVENLIEQGGDCEDSAILLAALLSEMGYACVLLHMPDVEPEPHMAMGVKGNESIPGTYYEYEGERYYYIEGTADYDVGEMPDWGGDTSARIIPVQSTYPTVVYQYATSVTNSNRIRVDAEIWNYGEGVAENTAFHVGFEDEGEDIVAGESTSIGTLGHDESVEESLYLEPSDDKQLRLVTSVTVSGDTHDFDRSKWQYPIT